MWSHAGNGIKIVGRPPHKTVQALLKRLNQQSADSGLVIKLPTASVFRFLLLDMLCLSWPSMCPRFMDSFPVFLFQW